MAFFLVMVFGLLVMLALFLVVMVVLVMVLFLAVDVLPGDAVGPVANGNGNAEVAALTVKGRTERAARVVAEAVLEDARDRFVLVLVLVLVLVVVVVVVVPLFFVVLVFVVVGIDGGIARDF